MHLVCVIIVYEQCILLTSSAKGSTPQKIVTKSGKTRFVIISNIG